VTTPASPEKGLSACLKTFDIGQGRTGKMYSLPALKDAGFGDISRLPVSLRMVLESLVRNLDGVSVTEGNIRALANWAPNGARNDEIPFVVSRIVVPDSSGVPLLADLAAMRDTARSLGADAGLIEPKVNVDLIIDHSAQVDFSGQADALSKNLELEFQRNSERYVFLKWARQAFNGVRVVPPGFGIIHQINLEFLSPGVQQRGDVYFPDTLVGADSHTPMINALGVVAWGVGGIEAEVGMLGEPIYFLTPDVVGVELKGALKPGVTATDAVLAIVERLRAANAVGAFLEYFGEGAASLSATDRATIANMTPETGATIGFFPADEKTLDYYRGVGRTEEQLAAFEAYLRAQNLWGISKRGDIDYTRVIEIDLSVVEPSVSGPRLPHQRVSLGKLGGNFIEQLSAPSDRGGFGRPESTAKDGVRDGAVVLAAITSCTNTSNPALILGAGLLARKAVERGMKVPTWVKTSFSPGSRAVSAYLEQAGLQTYLDQLGFQPVGYGCMTCLGNSGPLKPGVEETISEKGLVVASVLSGNRNFEARIHAAIQANFLMSPALVVAFALAGRVDINLDADPIGVDAKGVPVMLSDVWPTPEDIAQEMHFATNAALFRQTYSTVGEGSRLWQDLQGGSGQTFSWAGESTYIKRPPLFDGFTIAQPALPTINGARLLAMFGNSLTTDHISPGGSIKSTSPAGQYLIGHGIQPVDFNSYISRRGNHEVMIRGTFANVRIRNQLTPDEVGGVTIHQPSGDKLSIFDAAERYADEGVPLIVIAGMEYGTGSSRDWAAKGTNLLGIKAVFAKSFERIHRSNLVGMGVLPCQFDADLDIASLKLTGAETFDLIGVDANIKPKQKATLRIHSGGSHRDVPVTVRIDTPIEVEYYKNGGIVHYVLRTILAPHAQNQTGAHA
jgi:aconitate hydratase